MTTPTLEHRDELDSIIDKLNNLNDVLFPSLVWLWVWDVINTFYTDEELYIRTSDIVWEALVSDTPGFTLEYGTEQLYEEVRDWMFNNSLMIDISDMDDQEIAAWTEGKGKTYVQGR